MNIVLGVSGSVAAYRAADLARELMRSGHVVRVCLTDSASKFVTPALFEALTGQPCLTDTFEEPVTGRMAHIDWAREADLVLIAPATANTINRIGNGIADDMISTIAVATHRPILIAPAMNPQMYLHLETQASLQKLRDRGIEIIEPVEGDVACGENGQGKLASIETIVQAVQVAAQRSERLLGKKVIVTSGPTVENIDDVRYLSNRSSGKMGSAVAKAFLEMGAEVHVVAGPQKSPIPFGATIHRVQTALEMKAAVENLLQLSSNAIEWVVGVAAVADYRVENPMPGKMRRGTGEVQLTLIPNPDILASISQMLTSAKVVGFAAEPSEDLSVALEKIRRKNLFAIAANDISDPKIGFDSDSNELQLVFSTGEVVRSGRSSKAQVARWLVQQLVDRTQVPS